MFFFFFLSDCGCKFAEHSSDFFNVEQDTVTQYVPNCYSFFSFNNILDRLSYSYILFFILLFFFSSSWMIQLVVVLSGLAFKKKKIKINKYILNGAPIFT